MLTEIAGVMPDIADFYKRGYS